MDRKKQIGGLLLAAAVIVGGFPAGSRQTVTQAQKLAMQGNTAETVQVVSTGALTLSDATVDERDYYENTIYKQDNKKWYMKPGYGNDKVYSNKDMIEIYLSDAYANGNKKKCGPGILDIDSYGVSKGTVLNNAGNTIYKGRFDAPWNAGISIQTARHIYMVNRYSGGKHAAVIWRYNKEGNFQKAIKVNLKGLLQSEDKYVTIRKVYKGNDRIIEVFFVTDSYSGLAEIDLKKGRIINVRSFEGVTLKVPSWWVGETYRTKSNLSQGFELLDVDDTYFYYVYSTNTKQGSIYITIGSIETGKVLVTREILKKDLYKDPAYNLTVKDGYAYLLTRRGRFPGKTDKLYQINLLTGEMNMRKDFNLEDRYYNTYRKWDLSVVNENEFYIVYKDGFKDLTVVKYFTEDTIKLNKTKTTVKAGKSKKIYLSGTCGKTKWKSSNPKIATVNSKGEVTGKKAGSCKVTVTMKNKKYTCKVVVKK